MGGYRAIRAALSSSQDEYRGWRKFRNTTGIWPIWSIIASAISIPTLFAVGIYILIRALQTRRLPLIYSVLIVVVLGLGLLWYAIRRWAIHADKLRVQRLSPKRDSAAVERFIE